MFVDKFKNTMRVLYNKPNEAVIFFKNNKIEIHKC